MATKKVTVDDLKKAPIGAFLRCSKCGEQCSATHGDYSFRLSGDYVFKCCRHNMRLVIKEVRYRDVEAP